MHRHLGEHILELARGARVEAVVAAPFVKQHALKRIADELSSDVQLMVVTRWVPEEIAAGVSDLEVWEIVRERPNSQLRTLPLLHAKYFRFDEVVAAGSANVTGRALGWSNRPNLELLFELPSSSLSDFETVLLAESFEVDEDAYEMMQAASEQFKDHPWPAAAFDEIDGVDQSPLWFPRSLQVHHLYACYSGRSDLVIETVYEDGLADLKALHAPPGLGQSQFERFVAARLQQVPIVSVIDSASRVALQRQAGADLLESSGVIPEVQALLAWDTISAWLLHFFPDRYRLKQTFTGPAIERSQLI